MKKPDLSKAALSSFFLYHTEKLVLGVAVILLGLFFWMGFKNKPFDEKTPGELALIAQRADQYINSPDAWDKIKEFRHGDKDAAKTILNDSLVDVGLYSRVQPFTGVAAATLAPRKDPNLLPIQFPEAYVFRTAVILSVAPMPREPFLPYPVAGGVPDVMGGGGGARGGGMGAMGGGDDEEDEDEFDDDMEGDGESGLGRGTGGGRTSSRKKEDDEDAIPVLEGVGDTVTQVTMDTMSGVRPAFHGFGGTTSKSFVYDVVAVSGVVDYKQQWKIFNETFAGGAGYFPDRDKPIYQYLEVQRREVNADGTPTKGKSGEWADRSKRVNFDIPSRYPFMHQLPQTANTTAPDNIAPGNYDPILTGPIPPIVMNNYLDFVSHSKLDQFRKFPEYKLPEIQETVGADDLFSNPAGGQGFENTGRTQGGGRGMGAPGGGGGRGMGAPGGGGMGAPGGGGGMGSPGGGRGMGSPGGGGMGSPGGGRGMGSPGGGRGMAGGGTDAGLEPSRRGSDMTEFLSELDSKKPTSDYRLVRFFDAITEAESGKSFEYRMRAWLADPNNADPFKEFASSHGGGGMAMSGRGGMDMGEEDDYDGEEEEEEDYDSGGRSGMDGRQGQGSQTGEEVESEIQYVETTITSMMKAAGVRIRLNLQREVDNENGIVDYFVSETRGQDAEGKDILEEVEVPKVPLGGTEYASYLKHARPTTWSDPVMVKVQAENAKVAAGKIVPRRTFSLRTPDETRYIPIGEPKAEVAAAVWWDKDLGTLLPTRKLVSRGDALDFYTESYFLHPVTWQVHVAKNGDVDKGAEQYIVPIETKNVLVDIMGGGEIPLPKGEKLRHYFDSEMLVLDEFGNFKVKNETQDKTNFRNMLFLADESQTVGKKKKPKKSQNEEMEGGLGRGSGGDEEGDFEGF
ncbi:MAG: hypothetical protein ACI87E_003256 [Mariniblastus sp.]|jgi:hypothetical protein